ncbi:MAG: hypothetical protein QNL04_05415, partial [SAR324 cluster bacterium]|nr:hypothetical protein [SAR324 cluster bacterium]
MSLKHRRRLQRMARKQREETTTLINAQCPFQKLKALWMTRLALQLNYSAKIFLKPNQYDEFWNQFGITVEDFDEFKAQDTKTVLKSFLKNESKRFEAMSYKRKTGFEKNIEKFGKLLKMDEV